MSSNKNFYLLFLLLFCVLTGFSSNRKNILVLNSYHNGLSWTDSTVASIKRELLPNPYYTLYVEYLDTKRHFSEPYLLHLKEFYLKKYKDKIFDLIISTDNNAYDFLIQHRDEIFGEVPVIFSGLNSFIDPPNGYTGVFENFSFSATLNLIEKCHPNYTNIIVVSDHSTTGTSLVKALKDEIKLVSKSIRYQIIRPNSLQDLKIQLSELKPGHVVLYLVYNRDVDGNYCTYEYGFSESKPYCKVPIYCVWDFYLNRGAIGGSLITGRAHGKQVADMAEKVLSGTPIDELPPLTADYELIFDYNSMTEFGVEEKALPPNSKILNAPYSFVRENKEIVILALTIVILLIVIIIVMTINLHLRKMRTQKDKAYLWEIKEANQKLEKAMQEAEESSRLKSAFLANMSHEIRTPMNAILGFTELLANENVDTTKRKKFISIIQKNTNGLLRLISDILDISKIETNQLRVVLDTCKLSDLFDSVKEVYEMLIAQSDNKKLDFKINATEECKEVKITTDIVRLLQVFTNLIENSIKFTSKGGIEIGYEKKNHFLEFYVKDTGIGIPIEKQPIIFDRFRQAVLENKAQLYGGTGLGLAISKSLIEILGGEIWMRSKLNVGTTFYFTIPI